MTDRRSFVKTLGNVSNIVRLPLIQPDLRAGIRPPPGRSNGLLMPHMDIQRGL